MTMFFWPDGSATQQEILDRARLMVDLDEATDPPAEPSLLLVVGFPRPETAQGLVILRPAVDTLAASLTTLFLDGSSIYRTRGNEVCVVSDLGDAALGDYLQKIDEVAQQAGTLVAVGYAELPREAPDALQALVLADGRRIGAERLRSA
jgi:hypothetical protein